MPAKKRQLVIARSTIWRRRPSTRIKYRRSGKRVWVNYLQRAVLIGVHAGVAAVKNAAKHLGLGIESADFPRSMHFHDGTQLLLDTAIASRQQRVGTLKVLVADDHPITRLGVRQLIAQEWPGALIEDAESLEEAVRKVRLFAPDVIVLDLVMPDTAGTEGVVRMMRAAGSTPILVLSFNAESAYASRLLAMGVAGYLPKDQAATELVIALRRISEGKRYVTAAMADHLVGALGGRTAPENVHEQLSAQEYRVMLLIAAGKTPAEMAEVMHLSVKTIGSYRARILEKTGWKNNTALTKYCVQHQLTDQG